MFEKLTYYMSNGFRVVLHRDTSVKVVTAGVIINYGSMNETDGDNGMAHFIEHILSSDNRDKSELSKCMEKLRDSGAMYNATTDRESTYYYIHGMSDSIELYLKCLSLLVFKHKDFKKDIFENEKKVVIRELVGFYSSFGQINSRAIQALYGDVGIGRIIVGKKDNIERFTEDEIIKQIEEVYVPENSAIVVYGDFEYDKVNELINKYFGTVKDRSVKKSVEPVQMTPGYFHNPNFDGESAVLSLCYRKIVTENISKINYAIEMLLRVMLEPNLFKRMGYKIRTENGLAYNMGGFCSSTKQYLSAGVSVVFNKKNAVEVYKIMQESFDEVRDKGLKEEELEKAKRYVITNKIYEQANIMEQAIELIKKSINEKKYCPDNEIRIINKIQLDDINSVLHDLLKNDNLGLACIGDCDIDTIMEMISN